MKSLEQQLLPNRQAFAADPFGYSAMAWTRWAIAQNVAGFSIDPQKPPTSYDLKSPVIWLTQAHALSEAATIVLRGNPILDNVPVFMKGVCDSQYCAVGLMLVGYSLEICLKAMLIIKDGVETYAAEERKYKHHKLLELAEFIPDLNEKDKAILFLLTHFLLWAGRYPDPGSGRETDAEGIFTLCERHQITASDMFRLAARVMSHAKVLTA
jgi:hypothetical protein